MSLHEADIRARLMRFLDRKQMPRRFEGKTAAMEDEIRALCAAVSRNAPRGAEHLAMWWPLFEARLGEACGSMWPTEKELKDAGWAATQAAPRPKLKGTDPDLSPVAINARRMARGEGVGESWLYGRNAVELIASGQVDRETMERYRSAAFVQKRKLRGEEAARAWEDAAKAQHEAAKAVYRQRNDAAPRRDAGVPDKSTPVPKGYAA